MVAKEEEHALKRQLPSGMRDLLSYDSFVQYRTRASVLRQQNVVDIVNNPFTIISILQSGRTSSETGMRNVNLIGHTNDYVIAMRALGNCNGLPEAQINDFDAVLATMGM